MGFQINIELAQAAAGRAASAGRSVQDEAERVDAALVALAEAVASMPLIAAALSTFANSRIGACTQIGEYVAKVGDAGCRAIDVMDEAESQVTRAVRDATANVQADQ